MFCQNPWGVENIYLLNFGEGADKLTPLYPQSSAWHSTTAPCSPFGLNNKETTVKLHSQNGRKVCFDVCTYLSLVFQHQRSKTCMYRDFFPLKSINNYIFL